MASECEYWNERTEETDFLLEKLRRKAKSFETQYEDLLTIAEQAIDHYSKEINKMDARDPERYKDWIRNARENKGHWQMVAEKAREIYEH